MEKIILWIVVLCSYLVAGSGQLTTANRFVEIRIQETAGLPRSGEYVHIDLQLDREFFSEPMGQFYVRNVDNGHLTFCQQLSIRDYPEYNLRSLTLVFPVSLGAHETRNYQLVQMSSDDPGLPPAGITVQGEGLELVIENQFYRADLRKSSQSEAKSHSCGQLRELLFKKYHQLLYRSENRMHWGPNFQREDQEYYETIAGWENPEIYLLEKGPYVIRTLRQDRAPRYPEILLTAVYQFYDNQPYFLFYSGMEFIRSSMINLLRNDEMTMDTMFTHIAYRTMKGAIKEWKFSDRYEPLERQPVENEAPWLCFYHDEKKYAFGSIRLIYNITNREGERSPTFHPHTHISDGAEGGKYWNRRLISEKLTAVPAGSRYIEKNAYLLFTIQEENPFREIEEYWKKLKNPIEVKLIKINSTER